MKDNVYWKNRRLDRFCFMFVIFAMIFGLVGALLNSLLLFLFAVVFTISAGILIWKRMNSLDEEVLKNG